MLDAPDDHPIVLLSDAVRLAAFATTRAIVAVDTGVSAFGVVAVAAINAVGGGAFADILLDRSPFILLDDFYAICAVLSGSAYWLVVTAVVAGSTASAICSVVTVGVRLAAINYGWGPQSTDTRTGAGRRRWQSIARFNSVSPAGIGGGRFLNQSYDWPYGEGGVPVS